MNVDKNNLPDASREAVHAARDHAQKVEMARQLQTDTAAEAAADRVTEKMGDIMQARMEHVLARGTEQEKSIILARVPYICQDIKNINKGLEHITDLLISSEEKYDKKYVNQDQFSPYKWTLTLIASVVIASLVAGFMALVIIHK